MIIIESLPAELTIFAKDCRIRGWVISSNLARFFGSLNTKAAKEVRSKSPFLRISSPNSVTINSKPLLPRSTTSRASSSESTTSAPRSAKISPTMVLPEPIPPVKATINIC